MTLRRMLRKLLARFATPASAIAEESSGNEDPRGKSRSAVDHLQAGMERLRQLSKWLVVAAGSVAAVLVAGSQLSDLGQLDDLQKVTLFGIARSRFEWAVIGFGTALGAVAFIIAAAVWVQITSHLSLQELEESPSDPRWWLWGPRVRAKVRRSVDFDLMRRRGMTIPELVKEWRAAKMRVAALLQSTNALKETLASVRVTELQAPPVPWESPTELPQRARALVAAAPALNAALGAGCNDVEREAEAVLAAARDQAAAWAELLGRVLDDASYLRMRYSFGMVLKYIVAAMTLGGFGIATFAWASHPPDGPVSGRAVVRTIGVDDPATGEGWSRRVATRRPLVPVSRAPREPTASSSMAREEVRIVSK